MKTVAFGLLLAFSAFSAQAQLPSTHSRKNSLVARVYVSSNGTVHIVHRDGSDAEIPKQKDEVGRSEPIISDDRKSVGWVVDYDTGLPSSSPASGMLVIYRIGGPVLRLGGMPIIWKWRFLAGGKQVAFYTNTVHFARSPHFELRDVPTGRLLEKWNGPLDEKSPAWADALEE
jgi:hypothetical protein